MKAIVQHRYGSPDEVLDLRVIEKPAIKDDAVLVRVHAAPVHGADWHLMRGLPYVARAESGLARPRRAVPGRDFAGRVEAAGKDVTRFQPGDEVFGWCDGALAEYACAAEDRLAPKPMELSFEQAAAVPVSAVTALQALRDRGQIQPGQKVLINGASGGVGIFAVQIAKTYGAEVTGVCGPRNVGLVRSIGADQILDYTRSDFTRNGKRYDVILDMAQNRSLSDCRRALTSRGTLVLVGSAGLDSLRGGDRWFKGVGGWVKAFLLSPFLRQRLRPFVSKESGEDLGVINNLIDTRTVVPVVDRSCSLPEVAEAIRYVQERRARGTVVINV